MTMKPTSTRSPVLATALCLLAACGGGAESTANQPDLFTVARGDLPITVKENAELQALRETIIRSAVEGQTTIISIVPEGTVVRQGDQLVELDVSELVEKRATQAIAVTKADNAWKQSKSDLDILQKELTTKRSTAESNLKIARMQMSKFLGERARAGADHATNAEMVQKLRELVSMPPESANVADAGEHKASPTGTVPAIAEPETYVTEVDPRRFSRLVEKALDLLVVEPALAVEGAAQGAQTSALEHGMGEMSNKILQQVDQIRLAMADLVVKKDTYQHSRRLAQKQFITRNELERDQLAWQSQVSKVTLAWNDLDLLINYTLDAERIKLRQDVDNADLELQRVLASNRAAQEKAESDEKSKLDEFKLAQERLQNLERQIESAIIRAPTPGVVVYAKIDRGRGGEAVREGVQVRERQDLIVLPDTTKMRAVIKVQEAQVDKLAVGQPAYVQAEASSDVFTGRVTSVAPVADSNSGWMTSDRKVYTTMVELDGDNAGGRLRSRMAAAVTIQVGTVKDVLPVPSNAVRRDRSVHYVWKKTANGPVATVVEIGQHNSERVAITQGVAEGDVLLLTKPTGVQEPKFEQPALPKVDLPTPATVAPPAGVAPAVGSDAPAGDGPPRGDRGNRRGGGPGNRKKILEMTAEERTEYLGRLDSMLAMVERTGATPEQAQAFTLAVDKLRKALEANKLDEAQALQDALNSQLRALMGNRGRGGPGGGNDAGGPPGERGNRRPG